MGPIREPAVAGLFYPKDPKILENRIRGYLSQSEPIPINGRLIGLLAPHAGYQYSGAVAAAAYRQLRGKSYQTVVVLSPSHRVPFRGVSIMTRGAYRTPLGLIPLDEGHCRDLLDADPVIQELPEAHRSEHALEVQLPFLQTVLSGPWRLVPLILGYPDLHTARILARLIEKTVRGEGVLIVASSDLSHYHPADRAEKMDRLAINYMAGVDPEGFWDALRSRRIEACGAGPILTLLELARNAGVREGVVLRYAHSGDVTGDRSRVVGYAAMLWAVGKTGNNREGRAVGTDTGLTDEEKTTLKTIARTTIQCRLEGKEVPSFEGITERLREPCGAFVTLEKHHQLRGCIGLIRAVKPLYQTIQEMAEAAAFRDPRFPPLKLEEWPDIDIEISVLTPLEEITDTSQIRVGTHGIYIVKGPHQGLLLPQVATDQGWDRLTFLEHTCLKAGLPTDAWKERDTKIYIFSAEIF